jgi:hypothetical protein
MKRFWYAVALFLLIWVFFPLKTVITVFAIALVGWLIARST